MDDFETMSRKNNEREKNNMTITNQATNLPMRVFPVPGGPNNRSPLGGPRRPVKISLHDDKVSNNYSFRVLYKVIKHHNKISHCGND